MGGLTASPGKKASLQPRNHAWMGHTNADVTQLTCRDAGPAASCWAPHGRSTLPAYICGAAAPDCARGHGRPTHAATRIENRRMPLLSKKLPKKGENAASPEASRYSLR